MTTDDIVRYYADLLILQYKGKDRAYQHIQTLVTPVIMDQLPIQVRDAFNIDTAVGVQLDILGKYAGIARVVLTFTGLQELTESEYRLIIKLKIVENNSNSDLKSIVELLFMFFPTAIRVFDFQSMYMSYWIDSGEISPTLAEAFIRNGLLPKPMGVGLGAVVYSPLATTYFSFAVGGAMVGNGVGFNSYSDYDTSKKWLSADDLLIM